MTRHGSRRRASRARPRGTRPLLKGFGPDLDLVSLRRCCVRERLNVSVFRDRMAGIIGSVIGACRGAQSAVRCVGIAREALERTKRQSESPITTAIARQNGSVG